MKGGLTIRKWTNCGLTKETYSTIYPIDFKIDATFGMKTMYSEAILPEIDEEILLPAVRKAEEKLSDHEMERNRVRERPVKC